MRNSVLLTAAVIVATAANVRAWVPGAGGLRRTARPARTTTALGATSANDDELTGRRWRLFYTLPEQNLERCLLADFTADVDYEPPQGTVSLTLGNTTHAGRWLLSEDPEERKDGLWIWGLFKEPLYPFLLMTMPSEALGLPEGGQLYSQIDHKCRPDDDMALLSRGTVAVRRVGRIQADLAGLSESQYNDDSEIGSVAAQPMAEE